MADSTGIVTSWTYDAYGKATYTELAQSNPYLYTGRELDGTGLTLDNNSEMIQGAGEGGVLLWLVDDLTSRKSHQSKSEEQK